jgi:hypothetical protein
MYLFLLKPCIKDTVIKNRMLAIIDDFGHRCYLYRKPFNAW